MLGIRTLVAKAFASGPDIICQQTRNTFILRRRNPVPLAKKDRKLQEKLKARHFIYDLMEDTSIKRRDDMKIILTQFVDGVGNAGDILTLRPNKAYKEFLMPGLAVYANPKSLEEYKVDESSPKKDEQFSSPYVQRTIGCLSRLVLQITMNKLHPWVLEPWHVKTSFRKAGFIVPEYAIEMPPVKISGPDLSLQDKEFYVTVTINNREKVNVRCRIHHWATGLERLPWDEFHWKKPKEPLIPEQAPVLEKMPLPE